MSEEERDLNSYVEGVCDGKQKGWIDAIDIFLRECEKKVIDASNSTYEGFICWDDVKQIADRLRGGVMNCAECKRELNKIEIQCTEHLCRRCKTF